MITKKEKKKYSKEKTEKARTCGQAQEVNSINFSQQCPQPRRRSQIEQRSSQLPFQSQRQVQTSPNATISILKPVYKRDCIRARCKTQVSPLVLSRPKQHKLPLPKPADTESQATNLVLRQGTELPKGTSLFMQAGYRAGSGCWTQPVPQHLLLMG